MAGSIRVTPTEHQALLEQYRKGSDPRVRLRARIVLLLAQGYSWAVIAGVLFCSIRTIGNPHEQHDRKSHEDDYVFAAPRLSCGILLVERVRRKNDRTGDHGKPQKGH